jgi:hypothetical protein
MGWCRSACNVTARREPQNLAGSGAGEITVGLAAVESVKFIRVNSVDSNFVSAVHLFTVDEWIKLVRM